MTAGLFDQAGPRMRRRSAILSFITVAAIVALIGAGLYRLAANGSLSSEIWEVLGDSDLQRLLARGARATVLVAVLGTVFSFLGGVALAVIASEGSRQLKWVVRAWIDLLRGLPILMLIFFLFLGGPSIGINVSPFGALLLGFTLYNGAFMAEIIRAGMASLPQGQRDAALAIGLSTGQALALVLLPQAIRVMLPALVNQMVMILKESSLGFVVGYRELMRSGLLALDFLGASFALPIFAILAFLFIGMNLVLSSVASRLERGRGRARRVGSFVK